MTEVVEQPVATTRNPYVGPRSLIAGEPIYGRDRELDELRDALIADRLVLLYSPSGAGKSSLLEAGLRPALEAKEFLVSPTIRVSQHVEGAPNRYVASTMLSLEPLIPAEARVPVSAFDTTTLAEYVARVGVDGESEICLIFDQFEEVFTLDPVDLDVKAAFFDQLGELLRDRSIWAIIALREDYLAQLDPYLGMFPRRLATRMRLDFLDQRAALAAVRSPARSVGIEFTDDGAELLVDDLRTVNVVRGGQPSAEKGPYVEPVQLQVVCSKLWSQLPEGADTVTRADVEAHADTDNALAGFYADQVAAVAAGTGVSERVIRDWFEHSLITDQSFRGQSFEFPHARGAEVLKALEDAYLIRADSRRGVNWYELTHDRMIAPVIENNAAWRGSKLNPLQMRASEWEANGRPAGLLVTGEVLAEAETWAANSVDSTPVERDFVAASRVAENDARAELARHEQEARTARRRSLLFGALAVLAVVGLIVASISFVSANNSKREAQRSQRAAADAAAAETASAAAAKDALKKLTATQADAGAGFLAARSLASSDPYEAALLAIEAESRTDKPGPEPRRAWAAAVSRLGRQPTLELGGPLTTGGAVPVSMAWSPDNKVLAVAADDGGLQWFDGTTHAQLGKVVDDSSDATIDKVSWSPDGKHTIATMDSGDVVEYDSATHRQTAVLAPAASVVNVPGPSDGSTTVIANPSGKTIAVVSGTDDEVLQLFDAASGAPHGPQRPLPGGFLSAVWNKAGTELAVSEFDGTLGLYDGASGEQIGKPITAVRQDQSASSYIATYDWSPLGSLIAVGDSSGVVRVFDLASGIAVGDPIATLGVPSMVRWNPSQTLLAVGNDAGSLSLFDVTSHAVLGDPIPTGTGATTDVSWSPSGVHLATANDDGSIRIFDGRAPFERRRPVNEESTPIAVAAWSPDGTRVATLDDSGDVRLLAADAHRAVGKPIVTGTGYTVALDWSPDSRLLVTANDDGSIRVIRADSGAEDGQPLQGPSPEPPTTGDAESAPADNSAFDVAWNPHVSVIAAAMSDGSVRLYDATSRALIGQTASTADAGSAHIVRWSSDGSVLATAYDDGTLRLFDAPSLRLRGSNNEGSITGLWWKPGGSTLAVAGDFAGVHLLDDTGNDVTGDPLSASLGGNSPVNSLAWSPDDGTMAVGSSNNGSVRLYDTATHQFLTEVLAPQPNDYVGWLAWSPNGRTIAAALSSELLTFSAWSEGSVCNYLKALLPATRMDELVAVGGATSKCAHGGVTDTPALPIADHALP